MSFNLARQFFLLKTGEQKTGVKSYFGAIG